MPGMAKKQQSKASGVKADRHTSRTLVGIPKDVHAQLAKLAERNNRPLTWELRALIIKELEAAKLWPPPG
jgi:hypothetical protein